MNLIGFYNYTVILTYLGAAAAVCGIFFSAEGYPFWGIVCLLFACAALSPPLFLTEKFRKQTYHTTINNIFHMVLIAKKHPFFTEKLIKMNGCP